MVRAATAEEYAQLDAAAAAIVDLHAGEAIDLHNLERFGAYHDQTWPQPH